MYPCVNNFGDYIGLTHSLSSAERENFFKGDLVTGIFRPGRAPNGASQVIDPLLSARYAKREPF